MPCYRREPVLWITGYLAIGRDLPPHLAEVEDGAKGLDGHVRFLALICLRSSAAKSRLNRARKRPTISPEPGSSPGGRAHRSAG